MKKKILVIIMAIILVFCNNFAIVNADSGWDFDYDYDYGGSDWDFDSDWDYDDDWDYGAGYVDGNSDNGGEGSWISLVVLVIIIVAIIMIEKDSGSKKKSNVTNGNITPNVLGDEELKKYPNLNKDKLLADAFEIYKGIQTAWSNFDYDALRKLTTDEMYNMYKMQLDTLSIKNEKNIMKDFNMSFIGITDVAELNGVLTVKVRLNVSQKDYVVNSATNEVTRGNANTVFNVAYDLTFVNNVNKEVLKNCPNCGAAIENSGSQKCEYCNADLVGNSTDNWVLAKKETIKQWR